MIKTYTEHNEKPTIKLPSDECKVTDLNSAIDAIDRIRDVILFVLNNDEFIGPVSRDLLEDSIKRLDSFKMDAKNIDESVCLKYNSIFYEAISMADTLKRIDLELSDAAKCKSDNKTLLSTLCTLMYASDGYHRLEKYGN